MKSALFALTRKVRRSPGFTSVIAAPQRWVLHARQRLNPGIFSIDIEATCGFFAVMQLVLFVLKHCEERSLTPRISARAGLYGEPSRAIDWFAALFEPLAPARQVPVRTSRVRSIADLGFRSRYEHQLTLPMASRLFARHFRIRRHVLEEVETLCRELSVSQHTLGVHYRGTDKSAEARAVPREELLDAVRKTLATHPRLDRILLATDESEFADFFMRQDFGLPARLVPAQHLARNGRPVHFSGHPGLAIGREALVTCLLLSRCGRLIKTASYLSAWSRIFNPALPVWLLADSRYFPDRALWLEQQGVDTDASSGSFGRAS